MYRNKFDSAFDYVNAVENIFPTMLISMFKTVFQPQQNLNLDDNWSVNYKKNKHQIEVEIIFHYYIEEQKQKKKTKFKKIILFNIQNKKIEKEFLYENDTQDVSFVRNYYDFEPQMFIFCSMLEKLCLSIFIGQDDAANKLAEFMSTKLCSVDKTIKYVCTYVDNTHIYIIYFDNEEQMFYTTFHKKKLKFDNSIKVGQIKDINIESYILKLCQECMYWSNIITASEKMKETSKNAEITVAGLMEGIQKLGGYMQKENNKVEQFNNIVQGLVDTYRRKNADYGDSFGISVRKYGKIAALTRMSDKWNRLESLMMKGDCQVNESLEDTLLDLANYCVMTVMELRNMECGDQK